jgi:phage gp46-like protein
MSLQAFEGDLGLIDTPDGGDILIRDGLIEADQFYSTAVYLSLFGGNKADSGKVKNRKTWWGNTLRNTNENEKLVSRFQAITAGLPMSTKNIQDAEEAAALDLKWLADEGMADEITVNGSAVSHNRFSLAVQIKKGGQDVYSHDFMILWKAGIYGRV